MENLNAQVRSTEEKLSEVRAAKMVPAVVYGKNQEATAIKIDASEALRTFRKAGKEEAVKLSFDGKEIEVVFHDIQNHHITGDFLHIDFLAK